MAIVTDTLMTGPLMRQIKWGDADGDVFERASHLNAVAYDLVHHRHIPGEGTLVPVEGLDSNVLKRSRFFAHAVGG